jgi:hypothetical protein
MRWTLMCREASGAQLRAPQDEVEQVAPVLIAHGEEARSAVSNHEARMAV